MAISAMILTIQIHLIVSQSHFVVLGVFPSLGHQVREPYLFCLSSVLMINSCMASLILVCTGLSKNLQSVCWPHPTFKRSRSFDLKEAKIAQCFWWLCWNLSRCHWASWLLGGLVFMTITLGFGPLTLGCMMPNHWLYILKYPWARAALSQFPSHSNLWALLPWYGDLLDSSGESVACYTYIVFCSLLFSHNSMRYFP